MNNTPPLTRESIIEDMKASLNKNSIRSGQVVEQQLNSNIINNGERKGGRRIFKKRPTARRRRSSKARKSSKARNARKSRSTTRRR